MPVQFSTQVVSNICSKIMEIKSFTQKPFLLENITYYYPIPGSQLSEAEFISNILTESDCGLLLDVNNLYINSQNHKFDPYHFLNSLPLDRVVEIHIAGGSFKMGMLIDTHANSVGPEVWKLLEYACRHTPVSGIVLERDSNLTRFEDLLDEIGTAKEIFNRYRN